MLDLLKKRQHLKRTDYDVTTYLTNFTFKNREFESPFLRVQTAVIHTTYNRHPKNIYGESPRVLEKIIIKRPPKQSLLRTINIEIDIDKFPSEKQEMIITHNITNLKSMIQCYCKCFVSVNKNHI